MVAGEVKQLAAQTAQATDEIGRLVAGIDGATAGAVAAVRDIAAAVEQIDLTSAAIATAVEEQAAATQEIARTVAETTAAAREVADRIDEVSAATAEAGSRAADVRSGAAEARAAIAELRGTLVEVVRSATPEVDRRAAPRVALPRLVTLELAGQPPVEARLVDISLGGARIGTEPRLPPPARGTLRLAGIPLPLPFTLLGGDARDGQRLRFGLDAAASAALAQVLEGLAEAPAA